MKVDTQSTKNNIDNQDALVQIQTDESELLAVAGMPFSEILAQQTSEGESSGKLNTLYSLNIDYNYDSVSMNFEDAMFFLNLTQDANFSVANTQTGSFQSLIQTEIAQNTVSQKSVEVTNQLVSLIEKAQNTQKPVRISFDNNVSVVIKIDKHGKITAEFIPGNTEAENYLRNNIASLKQKFDEQNLPYNDLLYRQSSRQNKNKNKNDRGEK